MKTPVSYTNFQFDPLQIPDSNCGHLVTAIESIDNQRIVVAAFPFGWNPNDEEVAKTMAEQYAYHMNVMQGSVIVPVLDIDQRLYKSTNGIPHPVARLERIVIANLINHLEGRGFRVIQVYDGENLDPVTNMKEAMELIFNLDDSMVYFANQQGTRRWVRVVLGNSGWDSLADWCEPKDESDGWAKAMSEFDTEKYTNVPL